SASRVATTHMNSGPRRPRTAIQQPTPSVTGVGGLLVAISGISVVTFIRRLNARVNVPAFSAKAKLSVAYSVRRSARDCLADMASSEWELIALSRFCGSYGHEDPTCLDKAGSRSVSEIYR